MVGLCGGRLGLRRVAVADAEAIVACTHASRATRLATAPGAFPQGWPKVPPPNCSTESSKDLGQSRHMPNVNTP
jgi:hypothetical protein